MASVGASFLGSSALETRNITGNLDGAGNFSTVIVFNQVYSANPRVFLSLNDPSSVGAPIGSVVSISTTQCTINFSGPTPNQALFAWALVVPQ